MNPEDVGPHSLRGPRLQHQLGFNRAMVDGEPSVTHERTAVLLARGLATRADAGPKEGSIPTPRNRGDGIHTLFTTKRTPITGEHLWPPTNPPLGANPRARFQSTITLGGGFSTGWIARSLLGASDGLFVAWRIVGSHRNTSPAGSGTPTSSP